MENFKELLTTLYKEHAPDRIDQIDYYLEKYKGKESQFYVSEKAKYSKKRSVTDSKKILEEAMARIASQNSKKASKEKIETKPSKKEPIVKKKSEKKSKKDTLKKDTTLIKPKEVKKEDKAKEEKNKKIVLVPKEQEEKPKKEEGVRKSDEKEVDKLKAAKAQLAQNQKKENSRKKKSFLWIIILLVFVLVLILISVFYSSYFNIQEVVSTKEVAKAEEVVPVMESAPNEEPENYESTKEILDTVTTTTVQPEIKEETREIIQSTEDRLYADDIPDNAVFVSCFSMKKEKRAQEKLKQLKIYNLNAHYYWIPDIDAQGNPFFKVVVGPFKDVKTAYSTLTTVQERINFDAYILTIK